MRDLLVLAFAVFVGLIVGTLPGIREKFPWGQPSEAEVKAKAEALQAAVATPPVATATPTPPGSWMRDPGRASTLDKPAQRTGQ